jgi:hypothetical protein
MSAQGVKVRYFSQAKVDRAAAHVDETVCVRIGRGSARPERARTTKETIQTLRNVFAADRLGGAVTIC